MSTAAPPLKAQLLVLSCERRTIEVEQVRRFLAGNGYRLSRTDATLEIDDSADLILVSTCAYTGATEDLSVGALQAVLERKKPSAEVIVLGCLPDINPERLASVFQGPTVGPRAYQRLDELLAPDKPLQSFARDHAFRTFGGNRNPLKQLVALYRTRPNPLDGLRFVLQRVAGLRTRARYEAQRGWQRAEVYYIQIQQGCSFRCSYCSVRHAIKDLRSRSIDEIIASLQGALSQGNRDIAFIGDSSGVYGLDIGENLGRLLARVCDLDDNINLRLNDITPMSLHLCFDELLTLGTRGVVTSAHVPIQSANERVLQLMKRPFDVEAVARMLRALRGDAGMKVGTSVMVGFPSETRAELDETIAYCRAIGFDWISAHRFSARPRTVAANLPYQIPAKEKDERIAILTGALRNDSAVHVCN